MSTLRQIAPQPFLYINNMVISVASNTTLTVTAGQVRDQENKWDIQTLSTITIDAATNGVNGLDTGELVLSTWYYVYAIGDSQGFNDSGFILSTDDSTPLMPPGYDVLRKLGYALTDASVHFLPATVLGNGTHRRHVWTTDIAVLSAGTATVTTFTAIDCSGAVPPDADYTFCTLDVSFTPATAGDTASFRPTGSAATVVPVVSGVVAAQPQKLQLGVMAGLASGDMKIDYKNSAASGSTTVYVNSFEYDV